MCMIFGEWLKLNVKVSRAEDAQATQSTNWGRRSGKKSGEQPEEERDRKKVRYRTAKLEEVYEPTEQSED